MRKSFSIFWKAVKKMADLYVKSLDMINPFVVASSPATQGAKNVLKSAKMRPGAITMRNFGHGSGGGGFGSKSDGTMLEMSVLTEAEDLNAIITHFQTDDRFSCIFLWGASQGGFVSSYVAARRPEDVAAMVLEFPAFVLQDDAKGRANPDGSFPETESVMGITIGHRYGEDAVSFDIYDVIGQYKEDVLILHGDRDGIVPLRYSERAVDVYENAELVVMEGQNHGFLGKARTEAMERETAFFREHRK